MLIIEDNAGDVRLLREALVDAGSNWELIVCDRLVSGLAEIDARQIDLVLLDLDLPDSRGLDTLRRALGRVNEIPIVVLTGRDDEQTALAAMHAGAQDYLAKSSIDPTTILRITRYAIERNTILKRLRASDRMKSEFVATASHEMRTPLAIIREFVSLVHDGVTGAVTPGQFECLESALRNCDRLASLLDNLLDLSRIEAGAIRLSRTSCELDRELRHWVADFVPILAAKKQTLSLDIIGGPLPSVVCDAERIQQVVVNLIGNAHKFTDQGGRITVRARQLGSFVTIEVEDNGVGIAPDDQERIFDAFAQVGRRDGPGARGTGLGLTISKNIVELHGGSMSVTSTPGGGSTFALTIPARVDLAAELLGMVRARRSGSQGRPQSIVLLRPVMLGATDEAAIFTREEHLRMLHDIVVVLLRGDRDQVIRAESEALLMIAIDSDEAGARGLIRRIVSAIPGAFGRLESTTGSAPRHPDRAWAESVVTSFAPLPSLS